MKNKYLTLYQVQYFSYSRYHDNHFETYRETDFEGGKIYSTKEKLLKDYPNTPTELELIKKYDAGTLYDLPDGNYVYYTQIKVY